LENASTFKKKLKKIITFANLSYPGEYKLLTIL